MRTVHTASVAPLAFTAASLLAFTGVPAAAAASHAGHVSAAHQAKAAPSTPSTAGRVFAGGLEAAGAPITNADRWGPNNTVAFGGPTVKLLGLRVKVTAFDPFSTNISGSVAVSKAKTLTQGVFDQTAVDSGSFSGSATTLQSEQSLMASVWGSNFDQTGSSQ
jgi:hypothetical protein